MEDLVKRIDQLKIKYETLKKEIARKIVGQEEIIDKILVAIFSNGHCRCPRFGQDLDGNRYIRNLRLKIQADTVYAGFNAFRYYRY